MSRVCHQSLECEWTSGTTRGARNVKGVGGPVGRHRERAHCPWCVTSQQVGMGGGGGAGVGGMTQEREQCPGCFSVQSPSCGVDQ